MATLIESTLSCRMKCEGEGKNNGQSHSIRLCVIVTKSYILLRSMTKSKNLLIHSKSIHVKNHNKTSPWQLIGYKQCIIICNNIFIRWSSE